MRITHAHRDAATAPVWNIQPQQQAFQKADDEDDEDDSDDIDTGNEDDDDNGDEDDSGDDGDDDGDEDKPKGGKRGDDAEAYWKSRSRSNEKAKNRALDERDRATQQLTKVREALGLGKDDKIDPDSIARKFATNEDERHDLMVENTIFRVDAANAAALMDSRQFMNKVKRLDHEDDRFVQRLRNLVKQEVKERGLAGKDDSGDGKDKSDNTSRKGRRKSGNPAGGGDTPNQLSRADLAKMTPEQITKAQEKGQLNDLLGIK